MDNGLLFHLLVKFFIPRNYFIVKKGSFLCRKGTVVGEEAKQNIIWQMAWTIPLPLTFAVIPVFPVLLIFNTMVLMFLWGYKGKVKSGVLSPFFPPFFWVILCAASRRASGEGVPCSGFSWLLMWTSCGVGVEVLIWTESWSCGMVWVGPSNVI